MLHKILEANGGIPDNCRVLFANTGKEHPSTLDFVNDVGVNWGVNIVWLEYVYSPTAAGGIKDPKHRHKVVNHNSASRNGEPYWMVVEGRKMYLPNKIQRICTQEMKVNTMRRYLVRDEGWKGHIAYIGIRYDEPNRWAKALMTENCDNRYPMVTDKVTKADVLKFWSGQDFDLKTPDLYGNCDLCFLKGRRQLVEAIKRDPTVADWWIETERKTLERANYIRQPKDIRFRTEETYEELKRSALSEQTLWDGKIDVPTSEQIDCFCGD